MRNLILVTGANGFIGSRVVSDLLHNNYDVIALVHGNTNLLPKHNKLEVIKVNLENELIIDHHPFCIIHAAGQADPSNGTISSYVYNNIVATNTIVDFALKKSVKLFIYLSSISIYGNIVGPVLTEKTNRVNVSPYGMSKYFGEEILKCNEELVSISLRLPGVLGKGATGPWLSKVINNAKLENDITITNKNALFNNAVHVDDLSKFILSLIGMELVGMHVYNLAAKSPMTIKNIVEHIISKTNSKSKIIDNGSSGISFVISDRNVIQNLLFKSDTMIGIINRVL